MKPITKVFLVIATLVICLVIWGLFFNTGGIFQSAYNAIVTPINDMWKSVTGSEENLIKLMEDSDAPSNLKDAEDMVVD